MTVEERAASFLRANRTVDFCDDCLAYQLGINRDQARNATSGLGASRDFNRGNRPCSQCSNVKRVIHAR